MNLIEIMLLKVVILIKTDCVNCILPLIVQLKILPAGYFLCLSVVLQQNLFNFITNLYLNYSRK